jgi:hypothetical protein
MTVNPQYDQACGVVLWVWTSFCESSFKIIFKNEKKKNFNWNKWINVVLMFLCLNFFQVISEHFWPLKWFFKCRSYCESSRRIVGGLPIFGFLRISDFILLAVRRFRLTTAIYNELPSLTEGWLYVPPISSNLTFIKRSHRAESTGERPDLYVPLSSNQFLKFLCGVSIANIVKIIFRKKQWPETVPFQSGF